MTNTRNATGAGDGLRERKRRETLKRISEAGLRLFIANGFEATTIDAIASEAGISRRTFFYYFKSKDDILLSLESMGETLAAALRDEPAGQSPLQAVRNAIIRSCAGYAPDQLIVMDKIMLASAAAQARKQASYIEQEKTLLAALRERWPDAGQETAFSLLAMQSIGVVRLSLDAWRREGYKRPLQTLLREAFDILERSQG